MNSESESLDDHDAIVGSRAPGGEGVDPIPAGHDPRPGDGEASSDAREMVAEARDVVAKARDMVAQARDMVAQAHDRIAEARDRSAEARDKAMGKVDVRAAADRAAARADRERAASDRALAVADRAAAQLDRAVSAAERLAFAMDGLTGVYLRVPGFVELQREMARARRMRQPLVLAFADVDGLKAVNDSRGHAAGDRMLVQVAATLSKQLRPYDLIIRYGGDEFVCVLAGIDMPTASQRLSSLNDLLAASPEGGSITIGLAEMQPEDSPEDLLVRADMALYRKRRLHVSHIATGQSESSQPEDAALMKVWPNMP